MVVAVVRSVACLVFVSILVICSTTNDPTKEKKSKTNRNERKNDSASVAFTFAVCSFVFPLSNDSFQIMADLSDERLLQDPVLVRDRSFCYYVELLASINDRSIQSSEFSPRD
jgi:hypothetical protein